MNLLEGLNDKQHEAVINTEGPNLIIAGAGSRENKSINTQNSILNRRKKCKTMANTCYYIYK